MLQIDKARKEKDCRRSRKLRNFDSDYQLPLIIIQKYRIFSKDPSPFFGISHRIEALLALRRRYPTICVVDLDYGEMKGV